MAEIKTVEQQMEECTHNCMTCGSGCGEHEGSGDGVGKLEKTLLAISEVDENDLLKALQEIAED